MAHLKVSRKYSVKVVIVTYLPRCLSNSKLCTLVYLQLPVGCRYSSVDSSAPSIMPPRVQVQSTPSTLFSIYIVQIVYLSFELECEKNKNKQKEAGIGPFFKKQLSIVLAEIRAKLGRFHCNLEQPRGQRVYRVNQQYWKAEYQNQLIRRIDLAEANHQNQGRVST